MPRARAIGDAARSRSEARPGAWTVRFVALAVIWGLSFLLIKVGERSLAPLQVSLARVLTGAAALVMIVLIGGHSMPRSPRTWGHLAIAALLLNAIPFSLFAYGEQHVSSVLAGIWNATTPLFTLPVAVAIIDDEHATTERVVGLALGFAGVLVVLAVWTGLGGSSLAGNAMCLGAALSYGFGFPYARRYLAAAPEGVLGVSAAQLICATVQLAIVAPLLGPAPGHLGVGPVAAVVALGAVGTGVAYILNYSIIRDAGATVAATVTYVIPIVSTLAGVLLLGEAVALHQPLGAAVIVLGAAFAQGRLRRRRIATGRGRRGASA